RPCSGRHARDGERASMTGPARSPIAIGLFLALALAVGIWTDQRFGWVTPAFDAVSRMFHEIPVTAPLVTLAKIRPPSQIALVRWHAVILTSLAVAGCFFAHWLGAHGRRWWVGFCVGYAVRAIVWIAGGNLPLVPGDSCHYLEVAS